MSQTTTRRRFGAGVAGVLLSAASGCAAMGKVVPVDEFEVRHVELVWQATRAGVKIKVINHSDMLSEAPLRITLYSESGDTIDSREVLLEVPGGGRHREITYWFELHNVQNVKAVYGANVDVVPRSEV